MALDELTPEEQAQFDQMKAADSEPQVVEPTQEAPVEETAADSVAGAQEQPADKRPQMVPHAALHEERERRKAVEGQIAEERKARQTLEERTNLLLQRLGLAPEGQQQVQTQGAELPDLEKDPLAHIMGRFAQQNQAIESALAAITQRQQQDQQAQQIAAVQQRAVVAEREFRAKTEDYDAAVAHLLDKGNQELEIRGVLDPAQRQTILAQEALGIAHLALQRNENPAEMIYKLAELRGYRKTDKPAEEAVATTETPAVPDPAQRIDNARRGQQQDGRSLSTARGTGPRGLTAQSLVQMSESEFASALSTPEGRALLGE